MKTLLPWFFLLLVLALPGCRKLPEEEDDPTIRQAEEFLLQNNFEEAQKYVRRALEKYPNDGKLHHYLGNIFFSQFKYNQAKEEYLKAASLWSGNPSPHYQLSQIYYIKGKGREAMREIEQALALEPDDPSFLCLKGFLYFRMRNPEKARQTLEQCLKVSPSSALAHTLLGDSLQELGKLDQAVEHYERARELNPDWLDAYRGALEIYGKQEKYEELKRLAEIYLGLKASHPEIRLQSD